MAEATDENACVERHENYPYDVWRDSMDRVQRVRLQKMFAPVISGERVLDVGCNSGYAVKYLPKSCEAWGVDVSEELVAKARNLLAGAEVARAEALPFEDKSFDVVVLGEILEHVYDPVAVLVEAARVARRAVIGSTPTENGAWGAQRVPTHPFHVRCYTEGALREDLEESGLFHFHVERVSHFYVFQAAVVAK